MAQNLSRRHMMRLGATGVAAASIANLPVIADEKTTSDKLPKRRYGRTGLEIGWLVGASDRPKELIPGAVRRRRQLLAEGPAVERRYASARPQESAEGVVLSRVCRRLRER